MPSIHMLNIKSQHEVLQPKFTERKTSHSEDTVDYVKQ